LSGSFRSAVREGQAGQGRKHAKNRCNILDHFIYYLLWFVFELKLSRVFLPKPSFSYTSYCIENLKIFNIFVAFGLVQN